MLIYLDANIVQYCADYEDFIFRESVVLSVRDAQLLKELRALRRIAELEQLGEAWEIAAPTHLIRELLSGKPTPRQKVVYSILLEAWKDSMWQEIVETNQAQIESIHKSLHPLNLKDAADRWHLAEAIALKASWFLTNDKNIIRSTRPLKKPNIIGNVQGVRVTRPSECVGEVSTGLFLRRGSQV